MQLASAISQWSRWFKRWLGSGSEARTSSTPRRFSHWHTGQDPKNGEWRVIDEDNKVICRGLCDRDDAEMIAKDHNEHDPIKSREDWLYAKAS